MSNGPLMRAIRRLVKENTTLVPMTTANNATRLIDEIEQLRLQLLWQNVARWVEMRDLGYGLGGIE